MTAPPARSISGPPARPMTGPGTRTPTRPLTHSSIHTHTYMPQTLSICVKSSRAKSNARCRQRLRKNGPNSGVGIAFGVGGTLATASGQLLSRLRNSGRMDQVFSFQGKSPRWIMFHRLLPVAVAGLFVASPCLAQDKPKEELVDQVKNSIERGVPYLRQEQRGDGTWEHGAVLRGRGGRACW